MTYEEEVAYASKKDNKTPHDLELLEIARMSDEEQSRYIYEYVSGPDMKSWDWGKFPDKYRDNKELFKNYLNNESISFRHGGLKDMSDNVKNDREIADIVVTHGGLYFEYVSDELKNDKEFVLSHKGELVNQNQFRLIGSSLFSDKDFIAAIRPELLKSPVTVLSMSDEVSLEIKKDLIYDIYENAEQLCASSYYMLPEEMQKEERIINLMIDKGDSYTLGKIPEKYLSDPKIAERFLTRNIDPSSEAFYSTKFSNDIITNEKFMTKIALQNPYIYGNTNIQSIKDNKELALKYIELFPKKLTELSSKLRKDEDIVAVALNNDTETTYLSGYHEVVMYNPYVFEQLTPKEFKIYQELILENIERMLDIPDIDTDRLNGAYDRLSNPTSKGNGKTIK